ncbi:hypothetical protein B0T16DRAFT_197478 [Cercophora newfieldiana]|uniref:Uncharacterized protein n=1 Tax=Cercophora newfieldiana TaxID=92897 RepID=A0AA40CPG1_9PEZI|nr:hypothetical protein B0T16DRAFT_197478 [Cercophora newfieldiana]
MMPIPNLRQPPPSPDPHKVHLNWVYRTISPMEFSHVVVIPYKQTAPTACIRDYALTKSKR